MDSAKIAYDTIKGRPRYLSQFYTTMPMKEAKTA